MPNIGPTELIVILAIALLVLGPKKLPEVGKSLGKGIREFKDGISSSSAHADEAVPPAPAQVPPAPSVEPVSAPRSRAVDER